MVYDVVIIGGGPAALTAGIYSARKKLNALLLAQKIGGEQVLNIWTLENYPGIKSISGRDFMAVLQKQAQSFNLPIQEGEEALELLKKNNNFLITTKRGQYEARAIVIASGKTPRHLGISGEKEFEGKGVSFCSICDAPLFGGKEVAVIGGGNAGLDSALDLAKYATKIYVLEFGPKIIGDEDTQEKLKKTEKVDFFVNAAVKEIKGEKFVTGLVYEDRATGQQKELKVRGVFVHIGSVTSAEFAKGLVELNSAGEIVIDHKTNQTSVEGVFAAGDVTDIPWKQIVIAAGEGAKAALSAYQYLQDIDGGKGI